MFSLVIKEKSGNVGGWLDLEGEEYVVPLGSTQQDLDHAQETLIEWSDWMRKEIEIAMEITNINGFGLTLRPCLIESIALVYERG